MAFIGLRVDDEFTYYGVTYFVHSINPPFVSIQRIDGDKRIRELNYITLVTDSSFELINEAKRRSEKQIQKEKVKLNAFLDSLSEKERERVSSRFEMIKPVLVLEKAKMGDYISILMFSHSYKEYLNEGETINDLSKEKLLTRIGAKYEISTRQLKRYISSFNKAENELPNHGMDGLIRKTAINKRARADELMIEICHPKKKEKVLDVIYVRIENVYIPILKEAIEKHYLTKRKITIRNLEEVIDIMCHQKGLEPIDYNTIWHIIKKRLNPKIRDILRHGEDASREYEATSRGFSATAKAPLHIVEIDHTKLDMDVIDGESGANLGRPWITLGIDVYTRMIWCMHISFDEPSANKVRKAIQHGIFFKKEKELYNTSNQWDIYGIPTIIYVDNGSEFKNVEVKRMINETLKSQVMFRPVATPRYGGIIERVFGRINKDFIHKQAGTRKSNPNELGEYDAENEAIFTLEDIRELLSLYIVDVYHHDIHEGLPLDYPTPSARYYQALDVMGYPEFILPDEEGYYKMELLPTKLKSYKRDGIRENNVIYASQETSRFISKQKNSYKIKYDPDDISRIYVLEPNSKQYIEVPAQSPPADSIVGMNRKTYSLLLKVLREKGLINMQEIPGSRNIREAKSILQKRINERAKSNKRVRQQALKVGFTLTNGVSSQATKNPDKKMSKLELLLEQVNHEKRI